MSVESERSRFGLLKTRNLKGGRGYGSRLGGKCVECSVFEPSVKSEEGGRGVRLVDERENLK